MYFLSFTQSDKTLTYKMNFDFDLIFELLLKHPAE